VELLICEEMLLLALDNEKGGTAWLSGWTALSGGVLVDGVLTGALVVEDDRLRPGDIEPDHPLVRRVREAVLALPEPRTLGEWLSRLPQEVTPFLEWVAQRLVEAGVLTERRTKVLGIFPTTRFPEADPSAERELRARLHGVLVDGAEPSVHDLMLIALVEPAGLLATAVEDDERQVRRAARKRGAELAERATAEPGAGSPVEAVVEHSQAVVAAVAGAVAATTAAGAATIVAGSS
jgi:hypothetical protein